MKKLLASVVCFIALTPVFAQFTLSGGYTSASVKYHDVIVFGDSLRMKNSGNPLEIPQKQRGFNIGLGVQAMEGGGPYMRMGLNFSRHGQKSLTLTDGSSLRLRSTATDAYVAAGVMLGGGGGGVFYVLAGATYTTGRVDLAGNWNGLEGTYKGHTMKFSYGIGAGLMSETGFGLTIDLYCNFSDNNSKNFLQKGDQKLPRDLPVYNQNAAGYAGEYVRATTGYIRGQVTLHIPLGGK